MKRSTIIKAILGIILITALAIGFWVYRTFAAIPDMFERNGQLQAKGYYTGEFEFKMLACGYYLDHGQYVTAFLRLSQLQEQLQTGKGLVKLPKFIDKKAEMDFYLSLQNPRTGAFMDDSYPAVFYYEPTENVINHIEMLAKETGQPFHLRYPLRFVQEFDTPGELTACMDDLSRVGWIGAKLPKTVYVLATQFCSLDNLERLGLYTFTPAWKQALLKWFSNNQDPVTGTWGPRDRKTGRLINIDLNSTYHVIKLFVDDSGKVRQAAFPLRHRKELFATILQQITLPMPADSSSAEIHDWNLSRTQGVKMLTLDLWQDATASDRNNAQAMMAQLVQNRFEKFYRSNEGGFVYYPDTEHATLDGTGTALYLLENVGALSDQKRTSLWGTTAQTMTNLGERIVPEMSKDDMKALNTMPGVNSIRIYTSQPEQDVDADILCIVYPHATKVMDVADLLPRVTRWVQNTPQSMGNWTSREELYQELGDRERPAVTVYQGDQGLEPANKILRENRKLVLVGFDVLQVPRAVITLKLAR